MDCQYLNEANEALYECRYALKFTYVFAFYLPQDSNFRDHFEMEQKSLEMQVHAQPSHHRNPHRTAHPTSEWASPDLSLALT